MSDVRLEVTLKEIKGLERKMTVSVPAEEVDKKVHKRLLEIAPKVKLAGFRPGKVPMARLQQLYGESVRNEVISEVIRKSYEDALSQEKLVPVGPPKMQIITNVNGKPLEYEVLFEIFPPMEFKDLTGVEVKKLQVEIADEDVNKMVQKLQEQQAEWLPNIEAAKLGDRVNIDFEGQVDGAAFEGGSGKNVTLILGSHTAIPGFEEGLVGHKAGEEVQLTLEFPQTYPNEELAGKTTQISVQVHQVMSPKLAEASALPAKLGIADGGIEKLKQEVRDNMEKDLEQTIKNRVKEQIVEAILARNPVELPKILIAAELENIKKQTEELNSQGAGIKITPKLEQQWLETARRRVGLSLIFREFITFHQMRANPTRVQTLLRQMAAPYKDPESVIQWYRSNPEQLAMIEALALEEQIIEQLMKQVTIVPEAIKYPDLLSKNKTQPQDEPML